MQVPISKHNQYQIVLFRINSSHAAALFCKHLLIIFIALVFFQGTAGWENAPEASAYSSDSSNINYLPQERNQYVSTMKSLTTLTLEKKIDELSSICRILFFCPSVLALKDFYGPAYSNCIFLSEKFNVIKKLRNASLLYYDRYIVKKSF